MSLLLNEVFLISSSDKITSSSETFGEQEAVELMDILTQYLGMSGDVDIILTIKPLKLNTVCPLNSLQALVVTKS